MSKSPVLVTGGAGFIGSALVHHLCEQKIPVVVFDRAPLRISPRLGLNFTQVIGDLADVQLLSDTIKNHHIGSVVHLAALIKVEESVKEPGRYSQVNDEGTRNLLRAMAENQVRRLVFASTAAVYGEVKIPSVTEEHPTKPLNPYGQTKLAAEKAILDHAAADPEFSYLIFRFFNVAGSWPEFDLGPTDPAPTQLIRRACRAIVGSGPALKVFGTDYPTPDGSCIRDYIHVKDLIYGLAEGLSQIQRRPLHEILNLGYGSGLSVLEIVRTLEKMTGKKVPHFLAGRREGDPAAVVSDASKAVQILGLSWKHNSVEEICKDSLWWEHRLLEKATEGQ